MPPAASAPPSTSGAASATPAGATAIPGWSGPRLLLVVGAPSRPRGAIHDLAHPDHPGVPLELPRALADGGLAALAAAPGGRLAAIGQDGAAWVAPAPAAGEAGPPRWTPVAAAASRRGLPGPILGGTWSVDGSALVLIAGAPGSGARRTTLLSVPVDGSRAAAIEVPLEADGPAVAALPRRVVAFVGRDLHDRTVLARVAASGSLATLPVATRAVAAGGDLVAVVDDVAVRVGTLEDLERGVLPTDPLPLDGPGGIGGVVIAPDGGAVAVVRLDDQGAAVRVEVLRRVEDGWAHGPSIPLQAADATALPAWLP